MLISRKGGALLLATCLAAYSVVGWAYPVRWTLENFLFDDGGSAQGSFVLDGYTLFSDVQITTTAGTVLPGSSYNVTFGAFDPYYRDFSTTPSIGEGSPVLYIGWHPAALGSGADVIDAFFAEGTCSNYSLDPGGEGLCGSLDPMRTGMSGARLYGKPMEARRPPSVTVPEPDVVVLMGLGIAGIAFARMTRKPRRRSAR